MARYDRNTLQTFDIELESWAEESSAHATEFQGTDPQDLVAFALLGEEGAERLEFEPSSDGVSMQLMFDSDPVPVTLRPDNMLCVAGQPIAAVDESAGQIISLGTDEPFTGADVSELVRAALEHELARPDIESTPELEIQDEAYLDAEPEPSSPYDSPGWSVVDAAELSERY